MSAAPSSDTPPTVEELLDAAPPMSPELADRIAVLLLDDIARRRARRTT